MDNVILYYLLEGQIKYILKVPLEKNIFELECKFNVELYESILLFKESFWYVQTIIGVECCCKAYIHSKGNWFAQSLERKDNIPTRSGYPILVYFVVKYQCNSTFIVLNTYLILLYSVCNISEIWLSLVYTYHSPLQCCYGNTHCDIIMKLPADIWLVKIHLGINLLIRGGVSRKAIRRMVDDKKVIYVEMISILLSCQYLILYLF